MSIYGCAFIGAINPIFYNIKIPVFLFSKDKFHCIFEGGMPRFIREPFKESFVISINNVFFFKIDL